MLKVNINLIFTVINVIIIYLILNKMLFKKMEGKFARRAAAIDKEFEEAAVKQQEADQVKADYEKQLEAAEQIKIETIKEARAKADEDDKLIKDNAMAEAEKIKANAIDAAEAQKAQVMRKAEAELADMIMSATNKVVGNQQGANVDKALLDEFINKAGEEQ